MYEPLDYILCVQSLRWLDVQYAGAAAHGKSTLGTRGGFHQTGTGGRRVLVVVVLEHSAVIIVHWTRSAGPPPSRSIVALFGRRDR
jgi:hypothetical protein